MNYRTSSGLLGVLTIVGLAIVGIWGVISGVLAAPAGELVAPTLATLGVTVLVITTLVLVGDRSSRRRETPYW